MDPLKKKLFGALVGLARASEEKELADSSADAMIQGLIMACSDDDAAENALTQEQADAMVVRLHEEKYRMSPDCAACQCPCGRTDDYNMDEVLYASEKLRDAKLTLFALLGELAGKLAAGTVKSPRSTASEHVVAETTEKIVTAALTVMNESLFLIGCTFEAEQLTAVTDRIRGLINGASTI